MNKENPNTVLKIILHIDFSEEFGRSLLRGITKYSKLNKPCMFCRLPVAVHKKGNLDNLLNWAKKWGADGIIGHSYGKENLSKIQSLGIPFIAIDYFERCKEIPNITGDYQRSGIMAAEHLIERGFKNFAFYGFDMVWSRERAKGFEKRIMDAGYKIQSYYHEEFHDSFWFYRPSPLSDWLKDLPKPCGIMAADDNQALHISESCQIAEIKIPEEIAIIGVDNDEAVCSLINPPLSSVAVNSEKGGYEAAAQLYSMIKNNTMKGDDIVIHPTHVVIRQSTDFMAIEDKNIADAIHFIASNRKTTISVNDVVDIVPLSRRGLEKKFKKIIGNSIYKEIQKYKMQWVAERLIETNLNIQEIAWSVGISDIKNLSRTFINFYKISPSAFRKKFQVI